MLFINKGGSHRKKNREEDYVKILLILLTPWDSMKNEQG